MGKHFKVIEGGRGLRKDGLGEPRRVRPVGDPRYWPAQPRPPVRKPLRGRQSQGSNLWSVAPLALALSAATFWGVWTLTSPENGMGSSAISLASSSDTESASFSFCHTGGGYNCVVDGDTIHYKGTKIRIADIDTPETHPPRCEAEATKGAAATQRMLALVNAGPFTLESIDRDEDRYGRKLRVVTRGGESLGGVLVDEGLARWYGGGRQSWC